MIPVFDLKLKGKELKYVKDCIKNALISGRGPYSYKDRFEEEFAKYCGKKFGISTNNGTTALHLALLSLGIKENDEIIIPAFTMGAVAFAVRYVGAKPVFVDAERDTWNIDANKIEEKITDKTKAIIVVHTYGHPCDMDPILRIAKEKGIYVIEDGAEAHGAEYKNKKVGSFGDIACFSFFINKIITTGEGGMIITDDEKIAERARNLKDMAFGKGDERFKHAVLGFNYRMPNIQAAIGLAQLEQIEKLIKKRRKNARLYNSLLKKVSGITLPAEKDYAKNVYWMYSVLVEDEFGISRDELANKLKEKGIDTRPFFVPMHLQPFLKDVNDKGNYPVAEEISRKGINLPSGTTLTKEQIKEIVEAIKQK